MPLEQQVCSLELAKKLKKLGVKQESLFWYTHAPKNRQDGEWIHVLTYGRNNMRDETIPAFTVAELGEMLPMEIKNRNGKYDECYFETSRIVFKKWTVAYYKKSTARAFQMGDTEANARAKTLIYLIENGLLKVEDINN